MNWLMDVFIGILEKKTESKMAKLIVDAYTKKKEVQKEIGKVKSVYQLYMNPNNWLRTLTSMNKFDRQSFLKAINEISKEARSGQGKYDYSNYKKKVGEQDVQKQVLDKKAFADQIKTMNDELNGNSKWVLTSSSWVKRIKWDIMRKNKLLGNLYVQTKTSSTIYVYPVVPYDVYMFMKEATGENGTRESPSGAGSYFWKYWLDAWLPSQLRAKVKRDLSQHKITRSEAEGVWFDSVTRTANNFYKNNKNAQNKGAYRQLGYKWYQKQGQGSFRSSRIKTYREYYKKMNEHTRMVNEPIYENRIRRTINKAWKNTPGVVDNVKSIKKGAHIVESPIKYSRAKAKRSVKKTIKNHFKTNKKGKKK